MLLTVALVHKAGRRKQNLTRAEFANHFKVSFADRIIILLRLFLFSSSYFYAVSLLIDDGLCLPIRIRYFKLNCRIQIECILFAIFQTGKCHKTCKKHQVLSECSLSLFQSSNLLKVRKVSKKSKQIGSDLDCLRDAGNKALSSLFVSLKTATALSIIRLRDCELEIPGRCGSSYFM